MALDACAQHACGRHTVCPCVSRQLDGTKRRGLWDDSSRRFSWSEKPTLGINVNHSCRFFLAALQLVFAALNMLCVPHKYSVLYMISLRDLPWYTLSRRFSPPLLRVIFGIIANRQPNIPLALWPCALLPTHYILPSRRRGFVRFAYCIHTSQRSAATHELYCRISKS